MISIQSVAVQSYMHNLYNLRTPAYIVLESTVPELEEESMTQVHPVTLSRKGQSKGKSSAHAQPPALTLQTKAVRKKTELLFRFTMTENFTLFQ